MRADRPAESRVAVLAGNGPLAVSAFENTTCASGPNIAGRDFLLALIRGGRIPVDFVMHEDRPLDSSASTACGPERAQSIRLVSPHSFASKLAAGGIPNRS